MSMANHGDTPNKITYFAETDYRSKRIKFGIRDEDRARHMYIIGKTGMGKSTLLENLAIQDIQNGEGLCFIDPHGGTAETLLSYVPEHRINDVIYFAPFDLEHPVAMNVLEDIGEDKRGLVASGLMGAFKKVWVDAWSARMEYLLNNALLALLEFPGSTLLGVNRIFADKNYRSMIVNNVTDPSVKAFWVDEFAKYSDKFATEATAAIQNKVGQFASNPLIRNMVGQSKSTFDIRKVMDERKILIVNLSKGRMGEGNANLVGSMLITKIYLAAMSRADVGPEVVKGLPPFYLYVDEFQSFANESFADILSEARKYKLSLTVAHQYIEQMSDEVRAAVFGNVGTMVSFRVGAYDAEVLEKEFAPAFTAEDMVNLGFAQIYLKLMINGVGSPPFSATTLNRPKMPLRNFASETIAASRAQFARARHDVEDDIRKWHEPIPEAPRDPNAPPETKKFAPGMRPMALALPRGASAQYAPRPSLNLGNLIPASALSEPLRAELANDAAETTVIPISDTTPISPLDSTVASHESIPPTSFPITEKAEWSLREPLEKAIHQPFAAELAKVTPTVLPVEINKNINQGVMIERTELRAPAPILERRLDRERPSEAKIYAPRLPEVRPQFSPTVSGQSALPSLRPRSNTSEQTRGVSLSSLKVNAKRDKGPSTENLSTLKQALEAAMAARNTPEATGESAVKQVTQSNPLASSHPAHSTSSYNPPLARRSDEDVRPFAKTPAQILPPESRNVPEQKVSLLEPTLAAPIPQEVPLDVLRGVLSD